MDIIAQGAKFHTEPKEYLYPKSGTISTIPNPLYRFEQKKIQYNQNEYDRSGCTYFAMMTICANNRGINRTDEDIQRFLDNKKNYGRTGDGMYMEDAGQMVCDRLNSLNPEQGRKIQIINLYEQGMDYMKKGHMLQIGSFINNEYIEDIKDGAVNKPRGKDGIGHVRSMFEHTAYIGRGLVENYVNVLNHNVIDLVAREELTDSKQFYYTSFIIYPSGKMPEQINVEYNHGTTPSQQEIVKAREKEIQDGHKPLYSNYVDEYYIERMLIDIAFARKE